MNVPAICGRDRERLCTAERAEVKSRLDNDYVPRSSRIMRQNSDLNTSNFYSFLIRALVRCRSVNDFAFNNEHEHITMYCSIYICTLRCVFTLPFCVFPLTHAVPLLLSGYLKRETRRYETTPFLLCPNRQGIYLQLQ